MTSWLSLTLVLKRVAISVHSTYVNFIFFADNELSKSWRKRKHYCHLSYECLLDCRVRNNKCFFFFGLSMS